MHSTLFLTLHGVPQAAPTSIAFLSTVSKVQKSQTSRICSRRHAARQRRRRRKIEDHVRTRTACSDTVRTLFGSCAKDHTCHPISGALLALTKICRASLRDCARLTNLRHSTQAHVANSGVNCSPTMLYQVTWQVCTLQRSQKDLGLCRTALRHPGTHSRSSCMVSLVHAVQQ